jgi:methionine synthase II (cobalamin-independent)
MMYHVDAVGSYLRCVPLLQAAKKKEINEISDLEFRKIEDECVNEVVKMQLSCGLKIVTDGDYRRNNFFVDFLLGFKGVTLSKSNCWKNVYANTVKFKEEGLNLPPSYVENYIVPYAENKVMSNPDHPLYNDFKYLKSILPSGIIAKITVPSPLYLIVFRDLEDNFPKNYYKNVDEFYEDISKAYTETFQHLYLLGARVYLFIYLFLFFLL